MRIRFARAALCLLACLLVLLTACGQPSVETAPLPNSTPVPTQSGTAPVPTVQVPENSAAPSIGCCSDTPDLIPSPSDPNGGDVPALPSDEITELSYTVGDSVITSPAIRHYTLFGYAMTYDTEFYVCNEFNEGTNYWNSEGNYLSVSMVYGMPLEDMIAGLRLQENIAMEPVPATIGQGLSAQTLYLTTAEGLYRQFWVVEYGGDVLLVEQSYDSVSDTARLYSSSQQAMLDTLSLFY